MRNFTQTGVLMETQPSARSELEAEESAGVSASIRRFLASRGIQRHKQVLYLSEHLKMVRSTIHRKFKGPTSWLPTDLEAIARHFDVSVEQMLLATPLASPLERVSTRIGRCPPVGDARIGRVLDQYDYAPIVAVKTDVGWELFPAANAPKGVQRFVVEKLVFEMTACRRVAMLDDDPLAIERLAEELRDHGFAVTAYTRINEFFASIAEVEFDAYVLDWNLGGGQTAEAVMAAIRSRETAAGIEPQSRKPIIVLTGSVLGTGSPGIAATISEKCQAAGNAIPLSKPMPSEFIARSLHQMTGH